MKNLLLLPLLIVLVSPTIAMATDYYFCDCQAGAVNECVAGADSNAGTNSNSPRQTMSNARGLFNNLAAGDTIRFCRGGSFIASPGNWVNSNSSAANPVTLTDYVPAWTPAPTARPIITNPTGSDLFTISSGSSVEGFNFSNLELNCPGCSKSSGFGFFFYGNVHYVNVDNVLMDGFKIAFYPAANSNRPSHLTLTNSEIRNTHGNSTLGTADYWTMENNYIHHSGSEGVYTHNIYVSGGNHIVIRGNELYKSSADNNGSCQATSLVAHGVIDDLLVENNYVREDIGLALPTCYGIAIATGYTSAESFSNVVIRGNRVENVGGQAIGINACNTCTIENNIVVNNQQQWQNAIKTSGRSSNDAPMTAVTIRNNTIYSSSNHQSNSGISLGAEGTNHEIVGNVLYYSGTGGFTCLSADLPLSAYSEIDNNLCYFPNASSSRWESASGSNTLGAWQGTSGFGGNSANVNPNFTDAANNDFTPMDNTSAMVGKGHPTRSAPRDFRGKNRDNQPDAGAFEHGTYNPPAKTTLHLN